MEDEEGEGKVSLSVRGGGGGADGARTGHWGWGWVRGVYQAARERGKTCSTLQVTLLEEVCL